MAMLRLWFGCRGKFGKAATALCLGLVFAFAALMLPGVSARPAQAQDTTPGLTMAAVCPASDQLACSCETWGFTNKTAFVSPCFMGDVDRQVLGQADPFANNGFAALNWPKAAARGVPDFEATPQTAAVNGDYVTVWDSWPSSRALFRGDGQEPQVWGVAEPPLPAACQALDLAAEMARHADANVPEGSPVRLLDDYLNPDGDVLIDSSLQPVRYEILYNRQAYVYIHKNRLFDAQAVQDYLASIGPLSFPSGHWKGDEQSRGAIVIKAGWKILNTANDNPDRFHKSWAYVTPVIRDGKIIPDSCELQPVGLIAMHIAYKTNEFPDWLWTTFEHVAVAPTWEHYLEVNDGARPPYPDPLEKRDDWLFNPMHRIECTNCDPESPLNQGFEVDDGQVPTLRTRLISEQPRGYFFGESGPHESLRDSPPPASGGTIFDVVVNSYDDMDFLMDQGFDGTVFSFFRLKGAQWVVPRTGGRHQPEILANTVLEAFSQANSSCLSCHAEAGRDERHKDGHPYDYMFAITQCGMDAVRGCKPPEKQ